MKIRLEDLYRRREAHLVLSAYGLPKADVTAFRERWQRELDALFTT